MELWQEIEQWTSGDGYLDKLCMELVGIGSSRCRPPTRDIRPLYRAKAAAMLEQMGVLPGARAHARATGRTSRTLIRGRQAG